MTIGDMYRTNAMTKFLLILINMGLFTLNRTAWAVLGMLCLAGALYLAFRQGMAYGHEASGILKTVERAQDPQSPTHGQLDRKLIGRAWSVTTGIRAVLACALLPYVVGAAYIACSLLNVEKLVMPLRLASWVLAAPFWPLVLPWYNTFDRLTGVVAAVLMISPFLLPLSTFAGYMQGPRLGERSEKAMAEGKRRAKAKSRVVRKKTVPRSQRPEI